MESSFDPFFGRSVLLLAGVFAIVAALGIVGSGLHRPQQLGPSAADVAASGQFVAIFGGSRVEAGIDTKQLEEELSRTTPGTRVEAYAGGGWDMLHSYMLALLSRDVLRPGTDAVVIDVAAWAVNDTWSSNRLGAIRPAVAPAVAALPGMPMEARLDVLMGALSGLYRYRVSIHGALSGKLDRIGSAIGRKLEARGLLASPRPPPFAIVTKPGKNFAIDHIDGDVVAMRKADRDNTAANYRGMKTGGFETRAMERAVRALREKNIRVYMVQIPTADWFEELARTSAGAADYREAVGPLAQSTGARLLATWPARFHEVSAFWDGMHMTPDGATAFTHELAEALRPGGYVAETAP